MDAYTIIRAALILGGVGLCFGVLIALAHARLKVLEDPRIEGAVERLPGTNCGACSFAGCRAFAVGLTEDEAQPAGCTQLDAEGIARLADYLGVDTGTAVKRVARLLCAGGADVAAQQAEYRGVGTCNAAAAISGGGKACTWGCIGLADCMHVCDYGAITMDRFGIPHVELELCTACEDCVEVCPKELFVIMPVTQKLIVQCRSALEGDAAELICKVACTACGRCALDGAPGLIEMRDGLAVVDYVRNESAGPEAIARCPTGAIVWLEGEQFTGTRQSERMSTS